ncbi:MAG: hypothetical protein ACREM3_28555 [Candidatus Rokuibacteriota bacterium]
MSPAPVDPGGPSVPSGLAPRAQKELLAVARRVARLEVAMKRHRAPLAQEEAERRNARWFLNELVKSITAQPPLIGPQDGEPV